MKKIVALLLVLVLSLSLASCGGKDTVDTTTSGIEESTLPIESTTEVTSEPETASEAASTEETEAQTDVEGASEAETTEAVEVKLPVGKAEILSAYTAVVNKVKQDMPEYVSNDWQSVSNVDMSKATYSILNTAAKSFLESKADSTPGTHGKGTHAKWFAMPTTEAGGKVGCVLTDTSKITSASCVENGEYYIIKISLAEEKDPVRNMDNPSSVSSWHGKMFDVIDITQVTEYAKKLPGVNADNAYCTFKGTATLKYNPKTNECVSLDHVIDVNVYLGSGSALVVADYHFYDFKW